MKRVQWWAVKPTSVWLTVGVILSVSSGCGNSASAPPAPLTIDELVCEPAEPGVGADLLPAGLLANALYYPCPWPGGNGDAHFREVVLDDAILTGIPVPVEATPEGISSLAGRTVLVSAGSSGFYALPIQEDLSALRGELFWHEELRGGERNLRFAILAEGASLARPAIGPTLTKPLYVIRVGSGDVQINLRWSKKLDLDLHVLDPSGTEIFYGEPDSPSGGSLDLDSYAGCQIEGDRGRGNENVFWPDGEAPNGMYAVRVNLYDTCDLEGPISYRVTVVQDRTRVQTFEGTFTPEGGLNGLDHLVATFRR